MNFKLLNNSHCSVSGCTQRMSVWEGA